MNMFISAVKLPIPTWGSVRTEPASSNHLKNWFPFFFFFLFFQPWGFSASNWVVINVIISVQLKRVFTCYQGCCYLSLYGIRNGQLQLADKQLVNTGRLLFQSYPKVLLGKNTLTPPWFIRDQQGWWRCCCKIRSQCSTFIKVSSSH